MRSAVLLLLFSAACSGATFHVIVSGLGGEPEYESRFTSLARELDLLVRAPDATVETLSGPAATRAALAAAIARVAGSAQPSDVMTLTLIGHGTFDGQTYRFNLPGPDVTAEDLRGWLDRVPARQLIVIASSASGACIAPLRRQNRAIISATKSGTEKNATVFARYWVDALRDGAADSDKNESLSALEAYRFAVQRTARFYETQKRLSTEHALLEDTGKGDGVAAPAADNGQGLLASQLVLVRYGASRTALRDPSKQGLFVRKEELEQAIDKLKYDKAALPQDEYGKRLRELVLELARVQEQIEQ